MDEEAGRKNETINSTDDRHKLAASDSGCSDGSDTQVNDHSKDNAFEMSTDNPAVVNQQIDLNKHELDSSEPSCKTPLIDDIDSKVSNGTKDDLKIDGAKSEAGNKNGTAVAAKTPGRYDNAPDGGWGWVVTFSAFMVGLILDGISFSFGLFFKELLNHFKASKSQTSWIISVLNGTYLGIGPIASVLVAVFGCRKVAVFGAGLAALAFFLCTWSPNVEVMILLYGLLGGGGLGLLYLPAIVTVGHYFTTKRALATGIAVCGSGIGGFVFAPLSELLIEMYSWKGAMWIISAIVLNGIPIAVLLRPLDNPVTSGAKENSAPDQNASEKLISGQASNDCDQNGDTKNKKSICCCDLSTMFDFELLHSLTFLVYGASCFLCMLGFFIPFTYIPDLVTDLGMTSQEGAMLISIIGILNTVARVLVGWLADRPWADALIINSVSLVIGGIATMFVPNYTTFGILATYCVIFGVSIAVFVSLRSIIMAELLGIEKLTSSFGLVTMCQGLSAFIGAPIAGALSDKAGDYIGSFYLAGIAIALSGTICFPLRRISVWENRRKCAKETNGQILSSSLEITIEPKVDGGDKV